MTQTKINLLLLPLFVSILLSTAGKLKVGAKVDSVFSTLLYPITQPISGLRLFTEKKYAYVTHLPVLEKENREQKNQLARLISENEYLKQSIADKKILDSFKSSYSGLVPVRLIGSSDKFVVSSSLPLTNVLPGQPLVSGNILLGTVKEIKKNTATITPLNSDKSPVFPTRTTTGQKGLYKFENNSPQIVDVPSLSPIILGDFVLTEPGDLFPANLIIGKTIRLITISQEPLQKAEISLFDTLDSSPNNLAIITQP